MRIRLYSFKILTPNTLCLTMATILLISWQFTSFAKEGHKMNLSASAFKQQAEIPKEYTCDDIGISPALTFSNSPKETKSFALICDDPDAPAGVWVHWVLYNLPPQTNHLAEALPTNEDLADGSRQGTNDFGRIGYAGPCPPQGRGPHRYFFKLYALDTMFSLKGKTGDKKTLLNAMQGHILAEAQLMGTYERR